MTYTLILGAAQLAVYKNILSVRHNILSSKVRQDIILGRYVNSYTVPVEISQLLCI
jgi:hypothetical protein